MSAQVTSTIARQAKGAIDSILKASDAAIAPIKKQKQKRNPGPEHGQQIFVFKHLQKNHVVYSLTKQLNNNASLRQLPYNGKKTVPAALRKDLWHPFARISFQPGRGAVGLSVYQKLREYRRRHELEWGDEILKDEDGKLRTKTKRARLICDQKANSVADMAAVLSMLDKSAEERAEEARLEDARQERERLKVERAKEGIKVEEEVEQDGIKEKEEVVQPERRNSNIGLEAEGTGEPVEILWRDLSDAEHAVSWGQNIKHGTINMILEGRDGGSALRGLEGREKNSARVEKARLAREEARLAKEEANREAMQKRKEERALAKVEEWRRKNGEAPSEKSLL